MSELLPQVHLLEVFQHVFEFVPDVLDGVGTHPNEHMSNGDAVGGDADPRLRRPLNLHRRGGPQQHERARAGEAGALVSERCRSLPGDLHAWKEVVGHHESARPCRGRGPSAADG